MEKHGRGKRRTFSAEYKAEAVRLVDDSGKRISVIARELGLGETALRRCLVTPTAAPEAFCTSLRQLISERSAMGTFAGVSMDHPIYWAGFVSVLGARVPAPPRLP